MNQETQDSKAAKSKGGPKTEGGKNRSRFNAVRHGLTSQTAIFPWEEHDRYEALCRQMTEHFKPAGPMEQYYVQSMIDGMWKLNRSNAAESNLFALYLHEQDGTVTAGDREIDRALVQGLMFKQEAPTLEKMSRYSQRVENQVNRAHEKLKELQDERKRNEEEALAEAALLKKAHEKNGIAYNPAEDGFVLNVSQIDRYIGRQQRRQTAGLPFKIESQTVRRFAA